MPPRPAVQDAGLHRRRGRSACCAIALCLHIVAATAFAFELQGHRGARGLYPENTLPGFAAALALGVHTLELDTALSVDEVVVVSHDPRLNPDLTRSADGRWLEPPSPLIRGLSFAELERYDVGRLRPGSRYAQRFAEQLSIDGARIPSLAAVLALGAPAGVGFNIEFKLDPTAVADYAPLERYVARVLAVLADAGMRERATLQSFNWHTLREVRARDPSLRLACLTAERDWLDNVERGRPGTSPWTAGLDIDRFDGSVARMVAALGAAIWSPHWRDLTPAALAEAHALGLRVIVWTVNAPEIMHALIALGVDGIITDYPNRLREVMAARGLSLPPAYRAGMTAP